MYTALPHFIKCMARMYINVLYVLVYACRIHNVHSADECTLYESTVLYYSLLYRVCKGNTATQEECCVSGTSVHSSGECYSSHFLELTLLTASSSVHSFRVHWFCGHKRCSIVIFALLKTSFYFLFSNNERI